MGETVCKCGHGPERHVQGLGCIAGWTWDAQGCSVGPDGCHCEWAHLSSMTESEWRKS